MMNKDTTLTIKIGNTDPRLNTDYNEDKEEKDHEDDEDEDEDEDDDTIDEDKEDKEDEELVKNSMNKQNKRKYILHVATLNLRQLEIRKSETDENVFNFMVK